jgi:hypothetical protein
MVAETLASPEKFGDELQGLSAGTALACVLRPHGLALVPGRDERRQLQYSLVVGKGAREAWPVGWEPKKPNPEVLPELFESLNVEVEDIPLSQVVEVVGQRLKAPVLYDHLSLVRHDIDPTKIRVTQKPIRTEYSLALKKLLNQGKLTYELRVDDAERPLIWIRAANDPG